MKLSTKCRYGVRAMIEIAHRSAAGSAAVRRRDITESQGISHGYLENILIALKTRGLIRTVRGAKGGFSLERPASRISLLDIVKALEGSIAPVECVESPAVCERSGKCAARKAWTKLHAAQTAVLAGISLQDLVDTEYGAGTDSYAI